MRREYPCLPLLCTHCQRYDRVEVDAPEGVVRSTGAFQRTGSDHDEDPEEHQGPHALREDRVEDQPQEQQLGHGPHARCRDLCGFDGAGRQFQHDTPWPPPWGLVKGTGVRQAGSALEVPCLHPDAELQAEAAVHANAQQQHTKDHIQDAEVNGKLAPAATAAAGWWRRWRRRGGIGSVLSQQPTQYLDQEARGSRVAGYRHASLSISLLLGQRFGADGGDRAQGQLENSASYP